MYFLLWITDKKRKKENMQLRKSCSHLAGEWLTQNCSSGPTWTPKNRNSHCQTPGWRHHEKLLPRDGCM